MKKLHKVICGLMAVLLLCAMSGSAYAQNFQAEKLPLPAGILPPFGSGISLYGNNWNETILARSYGYVQEYYVNQGRTCIKINGCVWGPQHTISIGFYACDTSVVYGCTYTGGTFSNSFIYTDSIPSGQYWIFVYNYGTGPIDFSMDYEVYG